MDDDHWWWYGYWMTTKLIQCYKGHWVSSFLKWMKILQFPFHDHVDDHFIKMKFKHEFEFWWKHFFCIFLSLFFLVPPILMLKIMSTWSDEHDDGGETFPCMISSRKCHYHHEKIINSHSQYSSLSESSPWKAHYDWWEWEKKFLMMFTCSLELTYIFQTIRLLIIIFIRKIRWSLSGLKYLYSNGWDLELFFLIKKFSNCKGKYLSLNWKLFCNVNLFQLYLFIHVSWWWTKRNLNESFFI